MSFYHWASPVLKEAEELEPANEAVRAELKEVKGLLQQNRLKYGNRKRAELEGRIREYASFGLTREETDLLWHAGIMPWDNLVPVRSVVTCLTARLPCHFLMITYLQRHAPMSTTSTSKWHVLTHTIVVEKNRFCLMIRPLGT